MRSRPEVVFREATLDDAAALLVDIRDSDLQEIHATTDDIALDAVQASIAMSSFCWTVLFDGEVAAVFGASPVSMLGGIGAPWLLGTRLLDRHPRMVVQHTPPYIAAIRASYPRLVNWVDARNTRSIRWLAAIGFTIHPAAPYGRRGEPFHRFDVGFD